ncbi:gonadotropin-releasing hormone receptor [Galendromus occidentalis]|uniref:Gonadotropin-releasing hormone receptor n=1 Tax=Galendromus occidentalis TaxID=34638 RepID=A0AAJ6QY01_9ACAR|nr:gonadotropin-releasing hormone receptor [Galendromus occidentalis]
MTNASRVTDQNWSGVEKLAVTEAEIAEICPECMFNSESLVSIIVYSILFVCAAVGNVPVFLSLIRNRHRKSRIKLMMLHLAIADLIVTFIFIPTEIFWVMMVQWKAGDLLCKIFQVVRAFGPYLSSTIIICISLDRYFAVLHPLKVHDAQRRGKIMIALAWLVSLSWSLPQAVVYEVDGHPVVKDFYQCITFNFFSNAPQQRVYVLFGLVLQYGIPLLIIIWCYSRIMLAICQRSQDGELATSRNTNNLRVQYRQVRLRRSDPRNAECINRTRNRTLRLTVVIVLTFFWCWTPYVTMVVWYQIDLDGATKINGYLRNALFMFAVSNSCVNPLLYGSYAKSNWTNVFKKCFSPRKEENEIDGHISNSRQTIIIASGGSSHRSKIIYTGSDPNQLD